VEEHSKRDIAFTDDLQVRGEKTIHKKKVKDLRFCAFVSKIHRQDRILSTSLFFFSCFYLFQGLLYSLVFANSLSIYTNDSSVLPAVENAASKSNPLPPVPVGSEGCVFSSERVSFPESPDLFWAS